MSPTGTIGAPTEMTGMAVAGAMTDMTGMTGTIVVGGPQIMDTHAGSALRMIETGGITGGEVALCLWRGWIV